VTAVRELERPASATPPVPACQALARVYLDPGSPPVMMPCPEDAEGLFAARCGCGLHEGWAWLCGWCSRALTRNGCLECLEDEGGPHACLLTVRRGTEGAGHG
jgi:hypothetical protein